MGLRNAFMAYAEHLEVVALYSVLLVLGGLSVLIPGLTLSSGGITLNVLEFASLDVIGQALAIVFTAATLFVLSFLVSILMMAVKSRESRASLASAVFHELLSAHTSRLFLFFLAYSALALATAAFFPQQSAIIMVLVSLPLMFAPAAMVADEQGLINAVDLSWNFLKSNPEKVAYYLFAGTVLVALTSFAGYALDGVAFIGKYASLTVMAFFTLPLLIVLQAQLYLEKIGLMRK